MDVTLLLTMLFGGICFALPPQLLLFGLLGLLYTSVISRPSGLAALLCFCQLLAIYVVGPHRALWLVPLIWVIPLMGNLQGRELCSLKFIGLLVGFLPASFWLMSKRPTYEQVVIIKLHRALILAWISLALFILPIFSLVDDVPPRHEYLWYGSCTMTAIAIFMAFWHRKKLEDGLLALGERIKDGSSRGSEFFTFVDKFYGHSSSLTLVLEEATALFVASVTGLCIFLLFLLPLTLLYMQLVVS